MRFGVVQPGETLTLFEPDWFASAIGQLISYFVLAGGSLRIGTSSAKIPLPQRPVGYFQVPQDHGIIN
jgi:hypothetical protein